jgi:hypothetical protein
MVAHSHGIRCRIIEETDVVGIATLLAAGFPKRDREFWLRALRLLGTHESPPSLPKYGYLLESEGSPVGVILLIGSSERTLKGHTIRCNLSSWYVKPRFRAYAPMLVSQATRNKSITYFNVSPAPHTRRIIEAQGFSRYCDGVFVSVPMLSGIFRREHVKVLDARQKVEVACDAGEQDVLLQHAALGCVSLWCVTPDRAYPFVFRTRSVKSIIPVVQLLYCRDIADFARFAGPIGRFFALRGKFVTIVDANGKIPGLAGIFLPGKMPKYFKGPRAPRLGDLAYSEIAIFGV